MSDVDCMELARRLCGSSRQICDLLSSRIKIDTSILTCYESLQSPPIAPADPALFPTSMDVDEQLAHFGRLDALGAQITDWARLTGVANKTGAKLKRKISKLQSESRDNLTIAHEITSSSDDTIVSSAPLPDLAEVSVTPGDIRAFNDRHFGASVDVAKMCESDKQMLRPIFKHVPKLKDFILQLETMVEVRPTQLQDDDPKINTLLERLYELIVDLTYLEEHEDIYGRQDIEPYDDIVQSCLEQLYKQIMNQEN